MTPLTHQEAEEQMHASVVRLLLVVDAFGPALRSRQPERGGDSCGAQRKEAGQSIGAVPAAPEPSARNPVGELPPARLPISKAWA